MASVGKRRSSIILHTNMKIYSLVFMAFTLIWALRVSIAVTNPDDVGAINSLYASLGSPVLPGWVAQGGDPCGEAWQGVQCNGSDIKSILLIAANLGGELGDSLGSFTSIRTIVLSNNHIGGSIPSNLPVTLQNFFLSGNQFSGRIPESLSSLTLLTDMALNNNLLSAEIPDAFQNLVGLINLDLSGNNISGPLPPSMENLASLTTLHLQSNQLSGTLDVLQDLPLKDLNIENNLFAGPIPDKLLNIPNFRKEGNPFNDTVASSPPPASPPRPSTRPPFFRGPPSGVPASGVPPSNSSSSQRHKRADGPSVTEGSTSEGKRNSGNTKRIVWISIAGTLSFIILALAFLLFVPKCVRKRKRDARTLKHHETSVYRGNKENIPGTTQSAINKTEKGK